MGMNETEAKLNQKNDAGMWSLVRFQMIKYHREISLKWHKNFDDDLSTSHAHLHIHLEYLQKLQKKNWYPLNTPKTTESKMWRSHGQYKQ